MNLIWPLCVWVPTSLEQQEHSRLGHESRSESSAIQWMAERRTLPLGNTTGELEVQVISRWRRSRRVVFPEELISISHDDVTNIQLCIYRDTPKSACLSAVPSHSQVPHPLCTCVCMCYREMSTIFPVFNSKGITTQFSIHGILVE